MLCSISVPESWATVQISSPRDDYAAVGREFVMTCTVTAVRGLTVVPRIVWTGPDGNLTDVENITVGPINTFGLVSNRSLTLHYLQSLEEGRYFCKATVIIPAIAISLSISAYKELVVTGMVIDMCLYIIL